MLGPFMTLFIPRSRYAASESQLGALNWDDNALPSEMSEILQTVRFAGSLLTQYGLSFAGVYVDSL